MTSGAAKNEPCKVKGAAACAEDQKEMLVCRDGKFAHYRYCRGQAGCYTKDDAPACAETLSLELDECGLPGYVLRSAAGLSELPFPDCRYAESRSRRHCRTLTPRAPGGTHGKSPRRPR